MFAHCAAPAWRRDDFSTCFRRDYLQTLIPLIASGASLLYILVRLAYRSAFPQKINDYSLLENRDLKNGSGYEGRSDLPDRTKSHSCLEEDGLPVLQNATSRTKEYFIDIHRPRGEWTVPILEVIALVGEVCVQMDGLFRTQNLPAVAGFISWSYILALVTFRLMLAKRKVNRVPSLWNQTALLYGVHWVRVVLLFRSALINPRSCLAQSLIGTDLGLATFLLLITLCSRKGNKPVVLEYEGGLQPSREPLASLFSIATFSWVDAIVWHGYKKPFELDAVWNLPPNEKAAAVLANYRQLKKTASLAVHLLKHFKRDLLIQGAWAVANGCLTFVPTLLLKAILEYVENPQDTPINAAWFYVVLLACSAIAEGITAGQAFWCGRKICIKLHAIIVGEVYAKAMRRKAAAATDTILGKESKDAEDTSHAEKSLLGRLNCFGRKKKPVQRKPDILSSKNSNDSQVNTGTIINLMAVDSFNLSEICGYLHFLWATSPVQLVICILLLYRLLGYTSLISVAVMILAMPLNYYIAQQFSRTQKKAMAATDARIHTTNEVLQNIRIIKYFAWEQRFSDIIDEKRAIELRAIRNKYVLWTCAAGFWFGVPLVIAFFSFMLYTLVEEKPLIPSVAFTALSLFGILRIPLDQLADMIAHVQESKVSVDRIEEFLNEEETNKYEQLSQDEKDEHGQTLIAIDKATFTWAGKDVSTDHDSAAFRLIGMNTKFHVGGLNVIAGPTGSGKTSLLMALLGEMTLLEGKVSTPGGRSREDLKVDPETGLTESVAYCAQQAWLVNDNIKQNILFSALYDEDRYKSVIAACALERDLEILEEGDATLVGEKGITLSGGQKQRISLARALYCNSRHVLLDDCLSAVDSHTAKHIFENCILGPLMFGRTCILVTHNVALSVPYARHVVVLANGKIAIHGTPDEVISSGLLGDEVSRSKPNSKHGTRSHSRVQSGVGLDEAGPGTKTKGAAQEPDRKTPESQKAQTVIMNGQDEKANTRTEGKTTGRVKLSVMKMYLSAMGPWYFWTLALALLVGQQVSSITTTVWIRQWANSYSLQRTARNRLQDHALAARYSAGIGHSMQTNCLTPGTCTWHFMQLLMSHSNGSASILEKPADVNVSYYLGIYALLGLIYISVSMAREGLLFYGSLIASKKIHTQLLVSVTRAKFKFFDSTPLGQLMNRFSKDLEVVDQEVAPIAAGVLGCLATVISIVILISVITPGFLIAAFFISITYFFIGKFYLSSSTDLKRLESVQRSPLYQQFGETLSGVTTIRAYGDEKRFIRDNHTRVDTHHRPFIYLWAANRWLAMRVDTAGAMVSFFAGVFIVLSVGRIDAGAAGLSLTYAVTFTEYVLWLVRLYSANEQNMNSVERVKEYLDVDQEAKAILPDSRPDGDWPSQGNIEFINYSTRYRDDLQPVLKGITFNISAAERVGVVGRTGAGKSSLALALFRGLEADEGKIVIDGVDIGLIGLQDLREAITIVPQDPTLFTGTIRSNLDPFKLFTDEEIFTTLRQVHLIGSPVSGTSSAEATPVVTKIPTPPESPHPVDASKALDADDLGLSKKLTNTRENANVFMDLSSSIAESGSNLSQGQRQLLCLARALLKAPRVLLMDEATASIDYATDAKIQDTLRMVKDSTIITIAHRLQTIIDYDKVLVLDKGEVIEFGSPWALLSKEKGIFRGMCEMSGDFESLFDGAKAAEDKKKLIDV